MKKLIFLILALPILILSQPQSWTENFDSTYTDVNVWRSNSLKSHILKEGVLTLIKTDKELPGEIFRKLDKGSSAIISFTFKVEDESSYGELGLVFIDLTEKNEIKKTIYFSFGFTKDILFILNEKLSQDNSGWNNLSILFWPKDKQSNIIFGTNAFLNMAQMNFTMDPFEYSHWYLVIHSFGTIKVDDVSYNVSE